MGTFALGMTLTGSRLAKANEGTARLAAIAVRVLAYDRNLASRAGARRTLLVLVAPDDDDSVREGRLLGAALETIAERATVRGLRLRVRVAPVRSNLDAMLREQEALAVFASSGLDRWFPRIAAASQRRDVLTISGEASAAEDDLSVALVVDSGRLRIVVNRDNARREGVSLDAALLRLAELVE